MTIANIKKIIALRRKCCKLPDLYQDTRRSLCWAVAAPPGPRPPQQCCCRSDTWCVPSGWWDGALENRKHNDYATLICISKQNSFNCIAIWAYILSWKWIKWMMKMKENFFKTHLSSNISTHKILMHVLLQK